MSSVDTSLRPFQPGTTGWAASDLDDPEIEKLWFQGRYEIIDGVLTTMAPAYFDENSNLLNLLFICKLYARDRHLRGKFAHDGDIIIDESRVVVCDAAWLSADDKRRQRQAMAKAGKSDSKRTRLLIPPTLVIESVSLGHERHDRKTKFRWYAEFGVKNYWILDTFKRSLECWTLDGKSYRSDAAGRDADEIRPSLFPELTISLAELWAD
jgi:Uma2 family endonuclease